MIHTFFLLTTNGEILIEKHFREMTPRSVCDFFMEEVGKLDSKEEMPPVIATSRYYIVSICKLDIFMLATTVKETPPLLVIEFLHRVHEIFEEYFGSVDDSTIKENFATVYQLLEEMMDFGYPLTTEPNALKAMIQPPTVISKLAHATHIGGGSSVSDMLPDGTISNMPWRKTGVKYSQNEIYLDIVEEIDAIIDRHGNTISCDVSGVILANSQLSGVPDLLLNFNDPQVIDDCSFHPCVRYNRFERERVISFVPPDGNFELMKYRVNASGISAIPCYCQPQFSIDSANSQGSVSVIVGAKLQNNLLYPGCPTKPILLVEDVVVIIPFSKNVRTANLRVSCGTVLFDEANKTAKWTVGKVSAEKHQQLTGTFALQQHTLNESPNVQMHWKVPMGSVSGLSIASLQVTNEGYKPYKGVRTIAKSGVFQVRSV